MGLGSRAVTPRAAGTAAVQGRPHRELWKPWRIGAASLRVSPECEEAAAAQKARPRREEERGRGRRSDPACATLGATGTGCALVV